MVQTNHRQQCEGLFQQSLSGYRNIGQAHNHAHDHNSRPLRPCSTQAGFLQRPSRPEEASNVTALAALLSGQKAGSDVSLAGHTIKAPVASSRRCRGWRSVPLWPRPGHVSDATQASAAGLYTLYRSTIVKKMPASYWYFAWSHEKLCTVRGACKTLRDGKLMLGRAAALILDSSCDGLNFVDLEIVGVCSIRAPRTAGISQRCECVASNS